MRKGEIAPRLILAAKNGLPHAEAKSLTNIARMKYQISWSREYTEVCPGGVKESQTKRIIRGAAQLPRVYKSISARSIREFIRLRRVSRKRMSMGGFYYTSPYPLLI